jgi:hypothetical protein
MTAAVKCVSMQKQCSRDKEEEMSIYLSVIYLVLLYVANFRRTQHDVKRYGKSELEDIWHHVVLFRNLVGGTY